MQLKTVYSYKTADEELSTRIAALENGGGGGSDQYALKRDTVLETTLSRGRKAETMVGEASFAFGYEVEASGDYSHAEGSWTNAIGSSSHAEGGETQATGDQSHAEGSGTQATSMDSHAEGLGTIANGTGMHAQGRFNVSDTKVWPEWVANTSYVAGDGVTYYGKGYVCDTDNSDAEFDPSNWTFAYYSNGGEIAFVIGNGTADNARSNATVITWDGDIKTAGSLTIGAGTADEITITPDQLRKLIAMIPD